MSTDERSRNQKLLDQNLWWRSEHRGKLLRSEDDATVNLRDHEGLYQAFKRLTGYDLGTHHITMIDAGDGEWIMAQNGMVIWSSYPGASAIYRGEWEGSCV